jgi:heat shock protein HtpX
MGQGSMVGRAVLALALMVGFYALAIVMVGGLLYIPYAEWTYGGRIHLKIAFGCIAGAAMIAFAIIPRIDRFDDPGPELTPERFPLLFERLRHVAKRTQQAMPKHVFLVPEMNAFVANRGGLMGFGSRRLMGIGLPLMQVLTVSQLEAVLAHEFGHYHGGDTKLGPWVYKTRAAIGRTLQHLGSDGFLHLPFQWYGNLFLRVTYAVSRAQEFAADRLAASCVGARALTEGLRRVHATAPAFSAYWSQEFEPVLDRGYHVPLVQGFRTFLDVPKIREAMDDYLGKALLEEDTDVYDTHPALRDRIAAVDGMPEPESEPDTRPSVELLGDVQEGEQLLLAFLPGGAKLRPLHWDAVADEVFLPRWRHQAERAGALFEGIRIADLPALIKKDRTRIARCYVSDPDVELPFDVATQIVAGAIGAGLIVSLVDAGWSLRTPVGEPITLHSGDVTLEPFALGTQLAEQTPQSTVTWAETITRAGISDVPLQVLPTPRAAV